MPNVGGKKFPYTAQGMRQASKYSKATGTPMVKKYQEGGVIKGSMVPNVFRGRKGISRVQTKTKFC